MKREPTSAMIDRTTPQFGSGTDPVFFLGGGAPLRNGVADRFSKQILKANMRKKASSQGEGGVRTPCTLPLDRDAPLHFGVDEQKTYLSEKETNFRGL